MGFAQKIAAAQSNDKMSNSGTYGGAPPTGYTGGPPSALQAGHSQQYQAYSGSPAPQGSSYNPSPAPSTPSYSRPPQSQSPYPASPQGYNRPPPPPPGQPYASSPHPGQQPQQPYSSSSPYPGQQSGQSYGQQPQGYPGQPPYPGQSQYPGQQPGQQPYPGQQPSYNQPPSYPQGAQGAPYPGGQPQGRPVPSPGPGGPPGQYGAPGGPPGGAPGGAGGPAPPATQQQVAAYRSLLIGTIQEKNLQSFYPPERLDRLVQTLAAEAPGKLARLIHEWAVPMEVATDVMKLSLFDVILYVDDSGSIEFEEKGLRKDQLRQILGIVATAASTFDQDGISVRFMNSSETGDGIRDAEDVNRLVSRVRFSGLTPLGTNLKTKVVEPMIVQPARANRLEKPILVITITDGQPAGEPHGAVGDVIRYAVDETSRTRYGPGAVSFQFSQVGTDQRARDFLSALDEDPHIGHLIDCTSNFEVEQDEMSRANPPVHLTRELWCAKLMLGAIDSSYDTKDERDNARRGGGPQGSVSQYGGGGGAGGYPPQGGQSQVKVSNTVRLPALPQAKVLRMAHPPGAPPYGSSQSGYAPQGYQQSPQQPPQPQYQASRGYPPQPPQPYGSQSGYPPYGQPRY
ncbi:hypothetical protein N7452_011196 [Penicillium brevicompactum]|uniref:VWFA domain-containing protein n=1 Tax=Penicillium brevicompactum TaxID=5074 RepID=A0A9W9U7B8_PENBR|nr:hypothetical protein N7452_011196 [Penicillium brevicompactum]